MDDTVQSVQRRWSLIAAACCTVLYEIFLFARCLLCSTVIRARHGEIELAASSATCRVLFCPVLFCLEQHTTLRSWRVRKLMSRMDVRCSMFGGRRAWEAYGYVTLIIQWR
ncbi:hypothetical protein BDW22DRAFT_582188 [Trametopsis cervina]|nr:hypothetical protein BDW22DRAFT_582188 [Trametopsis cervina]